MPRIFRIVYVAFFITMIAVIATAQTDNPGTDAVVSVID